MGIIHLVFSILGSLLAAAPTRRASYRNVPASTRGAVSSSVFRNVPGEGDACRHTRRERGSAKQERFLTGHCRPRSVPKFGGNRPDGPGRRAKGKAQLENGLKGVKLVTTGGCAGGKWFKHPAPGTNKVTSPVTKWQ